MYPDIVSVIVPTCNRPRLLRRTLESLRAQTLKDMEVVVVNDAGEPVAEVATEYRDLGVKYVEHPQRRGLGAARNTGIANSAGRWVCYLDDDDTFAPEHLERTVGALRAGVSSVVYSDCCRVFERRLEDGEIALEEEQEEPLPNLPPEVHFVHNLVPVCSVVHARDCLEKTGVFDESLPVAEDYDLWLRFHVAGFHFRRVPGATSRVHVDLTGGQMTVERLRQFPTILQQIYDRYREFSNQFPGVEEGQQRVLRSYQWRFRLGQAFLCAAQGKNTLTLRLGEAIFYHGKFVGEIGRLLHEMNFGPNPLPLPGAGNPPRFTGPFGKKWLVKQLLKEIFQHPLPSFLRKKQEH